MQIVYNGPHPEVVVDAWNDGAQVIVAGQPVDIPDDLAARLLEQSTWAAADKKALKVQTAIDQAAADASLTPDPTPPVESAGPTDVPSDTTTETSS